MSSIGFKLLRYYLYDRLKWQRKIEKDKTLPVYERLYDSLLLYPESSSRYFTVFDLETTGFYPAIGD
ncbi:hypothetical protein R0J90_22840, partial [Micrococcus sp. SIMBA_144]